LFLPVKHHVCADCCRGPLRRDDRGVLGVVPRNIKCLEQHKKCICTSEDAFCLPYPYSKSVKGRIWSVGPCLTELCSACMGVPCFFGRVPYFSYICLSHWIHSIEQCLCLGTLTTFYILQPLNPFFFYISWDNLFYLV